MPIQGFNRSFKSITENALQVAAAFGPLSISASQSLATVLDVYQIPHNVKVTRVGVTAHVVSGSPCIQVVVNNVPATGSPGNTDHIAASGVTLFNAPITLTCNNYAGQTIPPANWDVIIPGGAVLTLRGSTGAGDTVTGLKINLDLVSQYGGPAQQVGPITPADY